MDESDHTPMNTDDTRQVLYAALLRYTSEGIELRDRVLDRIVLVALVGSSQVETMTTLQIQDHTVLAPESPGLRTDVIEETLNRLVQNKKVFRTRSHGEKTYYLSESGSSDIDEVSKTAAQLFRPVLDRMLQHTTGLFTVEEGETVCRTFITECFSQFGHQVARSVTGDLNADEAFSRKHIDGAFNAAIKKVSLTSDAKESLRARCNHFLTSRNIEDQELRFRLVQSYYIVQLLEISPKEFNPLAENAFSDALFYLDTNIVLDAVMTQDSAQRFREVVSAARSLGIELRVTDATLDEAISVATRRIDDIEVVIRTVPSELLERTNDSFYLSYQEEKLNNPNLTTGEFLDRFDDLPDLMNKLGIIIDNRFEEDIVNGRDVQRECKLVSDAAKYGRPRRAKSRKVSLHDVCHFIVVQEERKAGRKSWFLTRDHTLSHAAKKLDSNDLPFCFPLVAFLQSVSPFLEIPSTRHKLVDVFSAFLEGEIGDLSSHTLFEIGELRVLSELHADVLTLPADQLLPALDYVKNNFLEGKPYRGENHTSVALELRKFVVSSAHEKQEELLVQLAEQKQLSTNTQRVVEELRDELSRLKCKVNATNEQNVAKLRTNNKLTGALAVFGVVLACVFWWFDMGISQGITGNMQLEGVDLATISYLTRALGAIVFVGATTPLILRLPEGPYRWIVPTILIAIAIGASDLIGLSEIKAISACLALASPLAMLVLLMFGKPSKKN